MVSELFGVVSEQFSSLEEIEYKPLGIWAGRRGLLIRGPLWMEGILLQDTSIHWSCLNTLAPHTFLCPPQGYHSDNCRVLYWKDEVLTSIIPLK